MNRPTSTAEVGSFRTACWPFLHSLTKSMNEAHVSATPGTCVAVSHGRHVMRAYCANLCAEAAHARGLSLRFDVAGMSGGAG